MTLPSNLTFVFEVKELALDFTNEQRRTCNGIFIPPIKKTSFKVKSGSPLRMRWKGGIVEKVQEDLGALTLFGAATAFTQHPVDRLVAVNFDTTKRDVVTNNHGDWKPLSFGHLRTSNPRGLRSFVDPYESNEHLAAPGPSWVPQLVPDCFKWPSDGHSGSNPVNEGLVGRLAILLGLAAFAGRATSVGDVFKHCVKPNEWRSHATIGRSGRGMSYHSCKAIP